MDQVYRQILNTKKGKSSKNLQNEKNIISSVSSYGDQFVQRQSIQDNYVGPC